MKRNFFYLIFFLALTLSCKTISVSKDYDSSVDFTKYKTYSFPANGFIGLNANSIVTNRLTKAIDNEMSAKGFTKVSSNPDLIVNLSSHTDSEVRVNYDAFNQRFGYGYWRGFHSRPIHIQKRVSTDKIGYLEVHIIDKTLNSLVWIGEANSLITKNGSSEKNINKAITKILNKFPPQ